MSKDLVKCLEYILESQYDDYLDWCSDWETAVNDYKRHDSHIYASAKRAMEYLQAQPTVTTKKLRYGS